MVPFALQARRGARPPPTSPSRWRRSSPRFGRRVPSRVDELAAWLVGARADDPAGQLDALAELTAAHLEAVVLSSAIDDLLFDRVAAGERATRCCSRSRASRRRAAPGSPSASSRASTAPSWPTASSPTRCSSIPRAERCATRARSRRRSWQCCHQLAARILNRIGERAERVGQLCWALRAAELRLALPFDAPTRERLEADLRRVRARMN